MNRLARVAAVLCFAAGAVAISGCGKNQGAAEQTETVVEAIPITVALPDKRTVERRVEFVGTLMANEEVTVSNKLDGRVQKVYVDLGDLVAPGDLLAKLDGGDYALALRQAEGSLREAMARIGLDRMPGEPPDLSASPAVAKAKADLDHARANFERFSVLYAERVVSRKEYDQAETDLRLAEASHRAALDEAKSIWMMVTDRQAQVELAEKRLSETAIRSSLQGAVAKKLVSEGEYVKVGTPMFVLVQNDPLKLRGDLPERFAPDVKVGQAVKLSVDAFPAESFAGAISRISPAADPISRAFTVEARIRNHTGKLKPGFFARASVLTRVDPAALTVPASAVVTFVGLTKVFILEDNRARERQVRTGLRVGDSIEISEGLQGNEMVITSGTSKLADGTPVRVKQSPATL